MPKRPYTAAELDDSAALMELIGALDDGDESDEEVSDVLTLLCIEPLQRRHIQEIGPEKLSLRRLRREAAARIGPELGDDVSYTVSSKYGYELDWLPHVVSALDPPDEIETVGKHFFSGEEAVLILLRRYRSTDPLAALTWECGRSIAALSEIVIYMVEHVHRRFPHLVDERSFSSWAPHFARFAQAFRDCGVPIPNLIAFIDGKLWSVCRPGRYQRVLYSGHKRIHGLKTQGLVFPNGGHLAHTHAHQHAVSLAILCPVRSVRLAQWAEPVYKSSRICVHAYPARALASQPSNFLSRTRTQASSRTRSAR